MAYKLTQFHLDIIEQNLPPRFAALKDRYPSTIFNAADHWHKRKFPSGYVPKHIAIYYQESAPSSAISWYQGQMELNVKIEEIPEDPDVTQVWVDSIWTYICVKGQVILDRTSGIQFPPELMNHELMLRKLVRKIAAGNFKEFPGYQKN